jgi:hypothetical protein
LKSHGLSIPFHLFSYIKREMRKSRERKKEERREKRDKRNKN